MHKAIDKTFSILRSLEVKRLLEVSRRPTTGFVVALYSLGFWLSIDMHEAIVETFLIGRGH